MFYFLADICQENVFYDIVARQNTFLSHKNRNFLKTKN